MKKTSHSSTYMFIFYVKAVLAFAMLSWSIALQAELQADNNKPLVIQLKWEHQFQFAGYYAALQQGYFDEEGLQVELREGGNGINPLSEVLDNRADYGVSGGDLIYHRLKGKPVVVLASIFQHSASALATFPNSGVVTPHDLSGKKIAMLVGGKPIPEIAAMFVFEGIPLDTLKMSENSLTSSTELGVDAKYIYLTNEPYHFNQQNQQIQLIKPISYGIDFYGDSLFTTEKNLRNNPEQVKKIRRAVIKGWEYALQHKEEMIQQIKNDFQLSRAVDHLRFEADEIEKLILPNIVEIGHTNTNRWRRMADTFIRLNMIENSENFEGFLYTPDTNNKANLLSSRLLGFVLAIITAISLFGGFVLYLNQLLKKRIAVKTEALLETNMQLNEEVSHRKRVEKELQKSHSKLEEIVQLRTRELNVEIKEHRLTIHSLSESEKKLQAILSSINDSVYLLDKNKNIMFFHDPNESLTSLETSFIGKPLSTLIPENISDSFKQAIEQNKKGNVVDIDYSLNAPEGKKWFSVKLSPIFEEHIYQASLAVSRDISNRKEEEIELENAKLYAEQANQSKGQFLANISHDIRTPLNGINGMYYLLNQTTLDEKQTEYLENIHTSSKTLINMIDDILDFAKIEAGTLKLTFSTINIQKLIKSICKNFASEKDAKQLKLTTTVNSNIPKQLYGPDLRLTQVLTNLISNAIKYTDEHGHISITVEGEQSNNTSMLLTFSIKDTGIGISEEKRHKLFQPFSQVDSSLSRSYTGTGLGLAISQNLVHMMGGEIRCQSIENQGSCFSFSIPLQYQKRTPQNTPSVDLLTPKLLSDHVLVVDDDKLNTLIINELISPFSNKITTVNSAQEALRRLSEETFSIIFMDIQMPEMDGYEATKIIRQSAQHKDLPIIALTAHASKEDQQRSLHSGMNDHLTKPVSRENLIKTLETWGNIRNKQGMR